ncbi:hypothetical protein C2S52_013756 [Perilla frutescens var. hirtella]|nr:hypothetical protein C2S51_016033 [Perilla frutescens var. frutescens]KAH6776195.1 hypothetical protein C2S52_013756 [Perilla frutescens var. hirtella]
MDSPAGSYSESTSETSASGPSDQITSPPFHSSPLTWHLLRICSFKRWMDGDMPPYQRNRVRKLMLERDELELRLQTQDVLVKLMQEMIRSQKAEVERMISSHGAEMERLRRTRSTEEVIFWAFVLWVILWMLNQLFNSYLVEP